MAGTPVNLGTGTGITFATSGFDAQLLSVEWSGISREVVDTTFLTVTDPGAGKIGNRTYKTAIAVDPGTLECEFHFDPDNSPPIGGNPETITITFPLVSGDASAANWSAQGVMTEYNVTGISLDEKMVARATIKLTGAITITAAA